MDLEFAGFSSANVLLTKKSNFLQIEKRLIIAEAEPKFPSPS